MGSRSNFFVVLTAVLLIHEVVFSKCDLKTKTQNHLVKSNIDGFQRKERQAPIDPSRMYLPPKINAVESNGFGEQTDTSSDFGGSNNNGYGEVGPIQDTYGKGPPTENSNYDSPGTSNYDSLLGMSTSTANNNIATQTGSADDYGQNELLSTAQNQGLTKNNHNKATETSRFRQNSNMGNQYSQSSVQNEANGYSNIASSATKTSLQDNNRYIGQNSYSQGNNGNFDSSGNRQFSGDTSGYGNTALNSYIRKPTNDAYSQIGTGSTPNTQYNSNKNIGNSHNQVSNFNNRNIPSKSTSQVNNDINNGYNAVNNGLPNNRGFQAEGYNQGVFSTQSYGQNGIGKSNTNNLPSGLTSPTNNGFERNPANAYNQRLTGTKENQIGNNLPTSSQDFNSKVDSVKFLPGISNSYGQSSSGTSGLQQKGSTNHDAGYSLSQQNSLRGSNNYEQSGSWSFNNGDEYSQIAPASNNGYNQGSLSNAFKGFNQGQKNQQLSNNYRQSAGYSQSPKNEINFKKSPLNGRLSNRPNNFGQSQPSTAQISNDYSQTESQISSSGRDNIGQIGSVSSTNRGYNQGGSSNTLNGFGQNRQTITTQGSRQSYSPIGSQILSQTKDNSNQNIQNARTNDGYTRGGAKSYGGNDISGTNPLNLENSQLLGGYGPSTSTPKNNNYAQIDAPQTENFGKNSLPTAVNGRSSSPETSSLSSSYKQSTRGEPCGPSSNGNNGQSGLFGSPGTGSPVDSGYGIRNQKIHSTLVPKDHYQNSNLPNQNFEKQDKGSYDSTTNVNNNNGDYGESGLNAFSNFAPGNQPNQPPINQGNSNVGSSYESTSNINNNSGTLYDSTTSNDDYGEPGLNAFSNFAPGNQPNQPPIVQNNNNVGSSYESTTNNNNGGTTPYESTSSDNYGEPGLNAFSNFAPGNQPNQPPINQNKNNVGSSYESTTNNNNNGGTPSDCTTSNGDYGEPGLNAFSNFAPGNQPNQPSINQSNNNVGSSYESTTNNNNNGGTLYESTTSNNNSDEPGLNAFSNFAPGNQPNQPPINQNKNNVGSSYESTTNNNNNGGTPSDCTTSNGDYGEPGLNAFSNFAPGNQPNQPPIVQNNNNVGSSYESTTNNNNGGTTPYESTSSDNYGEPGLNAFSNFAPGNQPNQPPINKNKNNVGSPYESTTNNNNNGGTPSDCTTSNGDYGDPGLNAFSNFAPGNQPNQPPIVENNNNVGSSYESTTNNINNGGTTTYQSTSSDNYGKPGLNAFSNFAPGNQPNQPPVIQTNNNVGLLYDSPTTNNGEPGLNAFSNFAPGNRIRPNQPLINPGNNIYCGTNSNNCNNANKQTEAIFPSLNTGY